MGCRRFGSTRNVDNGFRGRQDRIPSHTLFRGYGGVAAQRHCCSTCRGCYTRREGVGLRRIGPLECPYRAMALSGRERVQESGMAWTMLRPHHFMQNLLAQAEYVIKEGAIYSPSGDGKIPYVDARDVAAVAFVTLTQPGHHGKTYVVTGSDAISYRQAAEIIGGVIGKTLRFVDESPEQARARRVREGVPPAVIESILAIGAYSARGRKNSHDHQYCR
jgi:NmrA-like family